MFVCLFIALFSTFIWINFTVAEIVNGKFGSDDRFAIDNRAKIKTYLVLIMAIFWSIVLLF